MREDYPPEQIGETRVHPINTQTKGRYALVLVQPRTNTQVLILEPCDWDVGRRRVLELVARGVNPADLWAVRRPEGCLDTEGLSMCNLNAVLWWTHQDQAPSETPADA